jgi:hypothetical protein
MSMPTAPGSPDLRSVDINEIYGELRRRNVGTYEVRQQLGMPQRLTDPSTQLKLIALGILGVAAAGLIAVIAVISVNGKTVPDVISGLAGSAIGAIAGILAGSASSGPATEQNQKGPTSSGS